MKFFVDTAEIAEIEELAATGMVDGVTTNPSLVAKSGRKFTEVVAEICAMVPGPVSVEAMSDAADDMLAEAQKLSAMAPNVVVKVPMTVDGIKAASILEREKDVRVNVTMVFSSTQAFLAMKTGATFVSIVLSRLDAVGHESDILVNDAVKVRRQYGFDTQVLAGSLKTQNHVMACLRAGVDIVTIPESLFFQMFNHPLTDAGIEQFKKDWALVPGQA